MRKKLIITLIFLMLLFLVTLGYNGYKNYMQYISYFDQADQYGVTYDATNYIVFDSEIETLSSQINNAIKAEEIKLEQERLAQEEAERIAKEEAERKAQEEAERKAQEEAERKAKEEAERIAKEEAEAEAKRLAELEAQEEVPSSNVCEPLYVNGILLVNKNHCLPSDFGPGGLTNETYNAVTNLISDAASEGIYLYVVSGYRSYDTQVNTFNYWVDVLGCEEAIKVSAEPGYSEHQTGLALDIGATSGACELEECFGNTPEGQWVAENAHEYGFIIRYPQGKESITGYSYEPWHLRYVGVDAATYIYNNNLTLEEYLGVY